MPEVNFSKKNQNNLIIENDNLSVIKSFPDESFRVIYIVPPASKKRTGYPTQNPVGILRRIIQSSSHKGDWVLDFFGGSRKTGATCEELGRKFVLIDQNPESIDVMSKRLPDVVSVTVFPNEQGKR